MGRTGREGLQSRQQGVPHPGPGALEVGVAGVLAPSNRMAIEPGTQLAAAHAEHRSHQAPVPLGHAAQVRRAAQRLQHDGLRLVVDGVGEHHDVGAGLARHRVQGDPPQPPRGGLEVPAAPAGRRPDVDRTARERGSTGRRERAHEGLVVARVGTQTVVDVEHHDVETAGAQHGRQRHRVAAARHAHREPAGVRRERGQPRHHHVGEVVDRNLVVAGGAASAGRSSFRFGHVAIIPWPAGVVPPPAAGRAPIPRRRVAASVTVR